MGLTFPACPLMMSMLAFVHGRGAEWTASSPFYFLPVQRPTFNVCAQGESLGTRLGLHHVKNCRHKKVLQGSPSLHLGIADYCCMLSKVPTVFDEVSSLHPT